MELVVLTFYFQVRNEALNFMTKGVISAAFSGLLHTSRTVIDTYEVVWNLSSRGK
jgi:hypothetical protein